MQYVLQTLTGIEERLAKLEESKSNQDNDVPSLEIAETGASNFQLNLMLGQFSRLCIQSVFLRLFLKSLKT